MNDYAFFFICTCSGYNICLTYGDLELEFAVDELFTALDGVTEPLVLGQLFGVTVRHQ